MGNPFGSNLPTVTTTKGITYVPYGAQCSSPLGGSFTPFGVTDTPFQIAPGSNLGVMWPSGGGVASSGPPQPVPPAAVLVTLF